MYYHRGLMKVLDHIRAKYLKLVMQLSAGGGARVDYLYRLVSPYDNKGVASLMYVTPEKDKAVFYAYKISHFINMVIPVVRMNGLEPSKNYRLVGLTPVDKEKPCALNGKVISGKLLMEEGIALKSLLKSEYSSLALGLQVID